MKYISEKIGDAYKEWSAKKPIIIHAPTGSGKTFFILRTLLPYAAQAKKKIVYICNRSALKAQVENRLHYDQTLRKYWEENVICTCSYQRFSFINFRNADERSFRIFTDERSRQREDHALLNADYYILDEAHYFLADCDFNMNVSACISRIKELQARNKDAIWVYMTATLPYLLLYLNPVPIEIPYLKDCNSYRDETYFSSAKSLLKYEEQPDSFCAAFDQEIGLHLDCGRPVFSPTIDETKNPYISSKKHFQHQYGAYQKLYRGLTEEFDYYYIEPETSHFIPLYYETNEQLIAAVSQSKAQEKWLIFVTSKAEGRQLRESFATAGYPDTVFLDSSVKTKRGTTIEKKVWKQIVEQEKFDSKILIATKMLDNGVNIKDVNLRHLVIQDLDQTTFLQMLGRKRFSDGEDAVYLYLKNIPEGTLRKYFQLHIQDILLFWFNLFKIQSRDKIEKAPSIEMRKFQSRYMNGSHYKKQYQNYVVERDMRYAVKVGSSLVKDDGGLLIDLYTPDQYTKAKLTYNYYKMMSLLERAYDERRSILRQRSFPSEDAYEADEKQLQRQQFIWIREQLSWIGVPVDREGWAEHPFHPAKPTHWISTYFGLSEKAKQELLQFLDSHTGALSKGETNELKRLYHQFLAFSAPYDPDVKRKGSVKKIQEFFIRYQFPYRLFSRKCMRGGVQRNWWFIEPRNISSARILKLNQVLSP